MVDCRKCEMLMDYPISVIDEKKKLLYGIYDYHFEDGFKCMYNAVESLNLEDLQKGGCRCKGE